MSSPRSRFLIVCALALLASPLAAQPRWTALGPYGGWVESLTVAPSNPQVVYAAVAFEGLFRSLDGGRRWTPVLNGDIEGKVAVDPARPGTVYASLRGRPWKSVDAGATWTDLSVGFAVSETSVLTLLADPVTPSRVYAGTGGGVWRSDDGGATWQPPRDGGFATVLSLDAAARRNGVTLYAGTTSGVYKSVNAGRAWRAANQGLPAGQNVLALAAAPSDPQTVYASFGFQGGLFRSRDGGATWQAIGRQSGLDRQVISLAVSPRRSGEVWIGTFQGLFRSRNHGDRWVRGAAPGASVRALAVAPSSPSTVYLGLETDALDPGGVFATTDQGRTWAQRNLGLAGIDTLSLAIQSPEPARLWAGTRLLSLLRSGNGGGGRWVRALLPSFEITELLPVFDVVKAPSDPDTVYATTPRVLWRTRDGGATWTGFLQPAPPTLPGPFAVVVDPADPARLWGLGERLLRSADGGETWTEVPGLPPVCQFRALAHAPSSPSTLYAGASRPDPVEGCRLGIPALFRSTDGGATWTETAAPDGDLADFVADLDVDPVDPRRVYAVGGVGPVVGRGLWRSDDGGATWTRLPGIAEQITSLTLSPLPDVLWAATTLGVVVRGTARGESWVSRDEGLTSGFIHELAVDPAAPNRIFAATSGGVWMLEDD